MGGGDCTVHQSTVCLEPTSALSADNKILEIRSKIEATPPGGNLLGILQPVWVKAVESDMRLRWLGEMLRRELVVRDIQHFGEGISVKLRAEN